MTNEFLEQLIALAQPKSAGAIFHIDETNSNEEYLHVDIPSRHATVAIKVEAEGIVVDVYPLRIADTPPPQPLC